MNAHPAIAMTDVALGPPDSRILDSINWTVNDGEHWVVLGQNGCGKTSLVRMAALYGHPSSGTVQVLGSKLGSTDVREHRKRIAFVSPAMADLIRPQLTAAQVVMTAKNAALEPWWHVYDADDKADAVSCLDSLGIGLLSQRTFRQLSSGERQRVLLARSLMGAAELILLDEPTAGLDLTGRERLVASMDAIAVRPNAPTQVLVTHHVEEIPRTFTHVLGMANGQVVGAGPIDELLTSEFVSTLFRLNVNVTNENGRYWAKVQG